MTEPCFKCPKSMCPFENQIRISYKKPKHAGRRLLSLASYHIIAPCGSEINYKFKIWRNGNIIKEFNELKHTIEYVINDLDIPLEDTLKLLKIKESIQ